ncbi:MAG TPA: hypothetical protein VEW26_06845 [Allosphingosinicella sp.]|nr:hypothetical protein [Allosphingosinicella sp.]
MRIRPLIAAAALMAIAGCRTSEVDVLSNAQICNGLAMYANGILSGSCLQPNRVGSPGANSWVCELQLPVAPANVDVHTTFYPTTPLHLTVNTPACTGNTNLTGTWPNLALASPALICGISPATFLTPLRAIPNTHTARAGFLAAQNQGILDAQHTTAWMNLARNNSCP